MSFAYLTKNFPAGGKIKVRGGQTDGYVGKSEEKISVEKYTPRIGKGSEYAIAYKNKEDKKYCEMMSMPVKVMDDEGPSTLYDAEELTSVGTVANVKELSREQDTSVYQRYDFKPAELTDQLKPIHSERKSILDTIESNSVCVIKGPTGCGKSTQIPQFILDLYVTNKAHCNIVVTQPRRIAAITITDHVSKQRGWNIGGLVGYQVALDRKCSEDTRLLYCTTGVLLEKLIHDKHLNNFTHIILDEVHEREEDMDFAILIVKNFLRKNSPNVKIILMSATLDCSVFANYFASLRPNKMPLPAPCYDITPKSNFKVTVYYLDSICNDLYQFDSFKMVKDNPGIDEELYRLIPQMIKAFNTIDSFDFNAKRSVEERAAVLIFLPGLYQIETLHEILNHEDSKDHENMNLWLCPLHSSITKDEQEKVRKYAPEKKRKVILSTNIAESSLTIPDVKYVIDFCLTKHLVADSDTGFPSLQLAWASHTNCIQREGRVGRVQDGRVYRLVPKNFYLNEMDKECVPEMQRCPLERIVLKCKKLMEDDCPLELISSAIDPPDLSNYEKTILKLKEIGGLLSTTKGKLDPQNGDLTFAGEVMASLPLDIHITKLILLGHVFDVLGEAIIMGCAMSVRNIFSEPFKQKIEAYNNKLLWADSSESDPIAYLNAYTVWRQLKGQGKFDRSPRGEEVWAKRYMLQVKHLIEVCNLEDDIKKRLRHHNIYPLSNKDNPLWSATEKPLMLKLVLAGAFYPHYFSRKPQNPNAEHDAVKMLAGHSPYTSVILQNMPDPVVIYEEQVKSSLRHYKIGDDMQIFTDSSKKAIVEFNAESDKKLVLSTKSLQAKIPGDIIMPVYRACKLNQLKLPIRIKSFKPNEVERELEKFRRSKIDTSLSTDYKPMIAINQQHVELHVQHVEHAGKFYAHIHPVREKLGQIHTILNDPTNLEKYPHFPIVDTICAAPYKDINEDQFSYYRGKVLSSSNGQVEIFFLDFGNKETILIQDLKLVVQEKQEELNAIPPLAVECVLAEVGPSVWSSQGGSWSEQATNFVKREILDKPVYAQVFSFVDKVASLYVYLHDNRLASDHAPPTLNDKLVKKGFAKQKQESYLSKENNRKRQECCENYSDGNLPRTDDDAFSFRSMSSDLKLMSLSAPHGYKTDVVLKGPNSPLEMKLFSITHCSTQRKVNVEWNSVNSVLLDSDPSDPHERILVAGSIAQSPDGQRLTLNHTTVLPNMHGLAALICLIFSPSVEVRADEKYSRFTGALCGLGMNEDGTSMFPENDIETPFDVEITTDDLQDINKIRYAMNKRFSCRDAYELSDGMVIDIQRKIKALILPLMKKNRPSVRVKFSPKPHVWGLIPNELLLKPWKDAQAAEYAKYVYKLNDAIDLEPENDRAEIQYLYRKLTELENLVANKLSPQEIKCPLCDVDFEYVKLLHMHLNSTHHNDLREWLHERARAHKMIK